MTPTSIPTIIDFSSARATHKGFGICYTDNPTVFTPGKDIYKLIGSCLARLSSSPIYKDISWIARFFQSYFIIESFPGDNGDTKSKEEWYNKLFIKYDKFNITDDNFLASLTPMDFINWFRQQNGEIFNKLVTVGTRVVKEKKSKTIEQYTEIEPNLQFIKSSTMKNYILSSYNKKLSTTQEGKDYDSKLLSDYNNYLETNKGTVYSINYNFPINRQYDNTTRIDYIEMLPVLQTRYQILSNHNLFLRYMKTLSMDIQPPSSLYSEKDMTYYNIDIIQNLPLYKLYKSMMIIQQGSYQDKGSVMLIEDISLQTIRILYPSCRDFLDGYFTPILNNFKTSTNPNIQQLQDYYPPHTLKQFSYLAQTSPSMLDDLLVKSFFGPVRGKERDNKYKIIRRDLQAHFKNDHDDIEILLDLRKYHTPFESDRGSARSRDISKLLKDIHSSSEIKSYLDFGGGDGSISSAIATFLNIPKQDAYSADIDKWWGRTVPKRYDNINYLQLKENQPLPLPDKSIDLITCFQVLHHLRDINFVLKEFVNMIAKITTCGLL